MSTRSIAARPVEPKRERGHLRVRAILDAAAAVLAEKGYESATMTEIAARSQTAIGSLYRFFPTKDALADALSQRLLAHLGERLDAVEARATALPPAAMADALLDLMLELRRDKAAVLTLMEVLGDAAQRRAAVRERVTSGIVAILGAAAPRLTTPRVAAASAMVLHLLRGVSRLTEGDDDAAPRLAELRVALALYLAHLLTSQPQ